MNEEDLNRIYKKNPDVVYRVIAGEAILVPISNDTQIAGRLFSLNEVGAFIWELIDGKRNLARILVEILEEHEVEEDTARDDLISLVTELEELGAIRLVDGSGL
ncbi:MAG: PqqD family protein [Candidatus Auribacterota bacterium]|nr:PqqD family protein [Candidatus Auribacterota bacterium]